jgi:hypothetical protein
MSKNRPAITARMKVQCLLRRVFLQFGTYLKDKDGQDITPDDPIQFDHIQDLQFGGPHTYWNLQPLNLDAHKKKSAKAARDAAHASRLRKNRIGEKRKGKGRLIPPHRFDKSRPHKFANRP